MYSVTFRPPSAPFHVLVSAQASLRLLHDEVLTWKKEKNRISIRSPYSWYCAIFRQSCLIRKVSLHGFKTWSKRKVALLDIFLSISYRVLKSLRASTQWSREPAISCHILVNTLKRERITLPMTMHNQERDSVMCILCKVFTNKHRSYMTWFDYSQSSFICMFFFF